MNKLKAIIASDIDIPDILDILNDATEYKLKHGDESWGKEPWLEKEIINDIKNKNQYIVYENNIAIGSFVLLNDDDNWLDNKNDALYLRKFAIKNEYHGQEMGSKIINLAINIAQQNNKAYLRLDCGSENKKLCDYYSRMGFKLSKIIANKQKALFEKDLSYK